MELSTPAGLTLACRQAVATRRDDGLYQDWTHRLANHISQVRAADRARFETVEFQRALWENEDISATGMGNVATRELWQDPIVIEQFWNVRAIEEGADAEALCTRLVDAWDGLVEHIHGLGQRIPRLKLARAFAALKPANFTTVASSAALVQLAKAMQVGNASEHMVRLNQHVLTRLDAVISDPSLRAADTWPLLRMKLPWMLFQELARAPAKGVTTRAGNEPGTLRLQPLPANRRRRGLLAIAGGFESILAMLEFAKDGCSRTDFRAHIHSINPNLAPGSIDTNINALIAEWGAIQVDDDHVSLTDRGRALLESGDPDDASDWLLTQILGFDNALCLLKDGPLPQKELVSGIQSVNPGWTSNFAPTAMLNWLRSLDLIGARQQDKALELTKRGQEWLALIDWIPGNLAPPEHGRPEPVAPAQVAAAGITLARPSVKDISASFPTELIFPDTLLARLDAALWSHPRRHFVVLTGLSGSGKTQLAIHYARALWLGEPAATRDGGMYILPVQPGWHDPSALLGYVNPLDTDTYIRTGFLRFLLNAARDPERAYTVVLDEMNLSHPEQYFAPLLSAMETGGPIELHANGDDVEEIPASVPYPSNLVVIGTINMDETTHGLSDKVLDRASVIEFWDVDVDAWPGWQQSALPNDQRDQLRQILRELVAALKPVRLHFAWRTIDDVAGYVVAAREGGALAFAAAVDDAIYAKVLPKLRGEDSQPLREAFANTRGILQRHALARSAAKLEQLSADLERAGIARFWR